MSAGDHLNPQQFNVVHAGPHPYGGEYSIARTPGGDDLGYMRYRLPDEKWQRSNVEVEYVHVAPEARRQGVASSLYRAVYEHTGTPFLHHRDEMTPAAKKTVAASAAEMPGAHLLATWRDNEPVVKAYPRKRSAR